MRYFFLILSLVLLAQTVLADDVYHTYHNPRFGYSIAYPKDILYPQGESDNGDGQKFLSKDADASLIVYGSNNALNQSLEDLYLEESRGGTHENPTKVIIYQVLKNNWFVVSGYNSGKVFYQKTILNKNQFKSFYFEYPESKKKIYDPITKNIASSFKSDDSLPPLNKEKQLTEQQALDILTAQIQKDKLYDSWAPNLSCLLFLTDKTKDYFVFEIREKHGGQCAGDPNTSPIVDRFRVDRLTKKIQWYEPTEGEILPYKAVIKARLKK